MAVLLVACLHHVVPEPLKLSDFSLYLSLRETERDRHTRLCAHVYTHTEGERENSSEDSLLDQPTPSTTWVLGCQAWRQAPFIHWAISVTQKLLRLF